MYITDNDMACLLSLKVWMQVMPENDGTIDAANLKQLLDAIPTSWDELECRYTFSIVLKDVVEYLFDEKRKQRVKRRVDKLCSIHEDCVSSQVIPMLGYSKTFLRCFEY